jgi:hypothetical protein
MSSFVALSFVLRRSSVFRLLSCVTWSALALTSTLFSGFGRITFRGVGWVHSSI